MEIPKEELEIYLKEQMENVFAYAMLTKDGMTITKFADSYYMKTSADSAEKVLRAISDIGDKNI
jgi:hypothetical protein